MSYQSVELKLPELAKVADDLANYLKPHPADDYTKAGALLFLYVVSQAQLPPPELAVQLFSKSVDAIRNIVDTTMQELAEKRQKLADIELTDAETE